MKSKIREFIVKSLIPIKLHHVFSENTIWTLKDIEHRHLLLTTKYAKLLGYQNKQELIGKTLAELSNLKPNNVLQIHKQEQQVIKTKKSDRDVMYLETKDFAYIYAVTTTPIFFEKKLVAFDKKFTLISEYDFSRFENSSTCSQVHQKLVVETEQERYVLSLLILHKTQHEIAAYLSLSRSRIVQIIAKLCAQFGLEGCSTSLLVSRAIAANFHQRIPPEIFMLSLKH